MGDESMSDILTIDTSVGIIKDQKVEPLPLYDENHPMLLEPIPEYKQRLPNGMMSNLIKRMKLTMQQYGGIGLSANQCGVFERVFVIGTGEFQLACINPKIISRSDKAIKADEGCLSFPALFCKIERPQWINVEFTNEHGQVVKTRLEGLTARCYLHELDHMNGIKFTSYVGPVTLKMAKAKQEKRIKAAIRKNK